MLRFSVLLISLVICSVFAGKHDVYSGFSVHGVVLRDRSDQEFLHELEGSFDLDVWQHGYPGETDARVMLTPESRVQVLDQLDGEGIMHYLQVEDVERALEKEDEELDQWRQSQTRNGRLVPFENYPRYDEVNEYLERVAAEHSDIVQLVDAGLSFDGRTIKYLKISSSNFSDPTKPIYFMDAMIHAREWVTTPVTLYSIHRLVEDLREEDSDLLRDINWIVLPIVNPDGYEFTHTDFRLWRRTRSFNPDVSLTCYGADANRNFDVNFNTTSGVSSNPCNDQYTGQAPFSESETRIVRDIMMEHLDRIQIYMNIHSHGNWVLYGFGNTSLPSNAVPLHHLGAAMGAAMDTTMLPQAVHYRVGNSALLLYPTSGSAQDYGQAVGIPFSYTLELPGYGFGFQVPPQHINHINQETWRGIAVTARLARSHFLASN